MCWAGIELIFSPVAGTALCFGFRTRAVLVTHRFFRRLSCAYTKPRTFQLLIQPYQQSPPVCKLLGGDTARRVDPDKSTRSSIPCDIMPSIESGRSWPGTPWLEDELGIGQRVVGNRTVHHSFVCSIAIVVSPSFSVLSNCLCHNPRVPAFFSLIPPHWLRGVGWVWGWWRDGGREGSEGAAAWFLIVGGG